jgi:hypothetical protein
VIAGNVPVLADDGISHEDALVLGAAYEMDGTIRAPVNETWGSDESKIDMHNNLVGSPIGDAVVRGKGQSDAGPAQSEAIRWTLMLVQQDPGCAACLNLQGG